ncbi:MAG: hypothetical protein WCP34_01835 [Pseudomonadota bacterium]
MLPILNRFSLVLLWGLLGSSFAMASSLDQAALADAQGHGAPAAPAHGVPASAHVVAKHATSRKAVKKTQASPATGQLQQQLRVRDTEIHELKARLAELEAHRPSDPTVRMPQPLSYEQFTAPISYP